MSEKIKNLVKCWEHCPVCGALLVRSPGSLYCSHCGFEEMVLEEFYVSWWMQPKIDGKRTALDDVPDVAAA